MRHASKEGFTIVEILVVVGILVVLMAIVLASGTTSRAKARDARRTADLGQMQLALDWYYRDNGHFPKPSALGCASEIAWSSSSCWASLLPSKYIASVPVDPTNVDAGSCESAADCHVYEYCYLAGGEKYVLAVNLEIPQERPQDNPSAQGCANGGPNWYWVTN